MNQLASFQYAFIILGIIIVVTFVSLLYIKKVKKTDKTQIQSNMQVERQVQKDDDSISEKQDLNDNISFNLDGWGETAALYSEPTARKNYIKLETVGKGKEGRYTGVMTDKIIIGRVSSESVIGILNDRSISRENSMIRYEDGNMYIEDIGSRFGTYVNGIKITERTQLHQQDIIHIGNTDLQIDWISE